MKRLICIELLEEHEAANFYTVRFDDEHQSLFDQFIRASSSTKSLYVVVAWLDKIGKIGALERYFRPEGHPKVKAIPVPPPSSELRLYCYRFSDNLLLIGGGKEKRVRAFQDDDELFMHVKIIQKAGRAIERYLESGEIEINGRFLEGKLKFNIEL